MISTYELTAPRFNRNIVECKVRVFFSVFAELLVLIETLWNVKVYIICENVDDGLSFNRNIVECKVHRECSAAEWTLVLIETLWNVKCTISLVYIACRTF